MTQLSKTNFKTLYGSSGTTFLDNTTGDISESDVRAFGEDIADSFKVYDSSEAPILKTTTVTLTAAQIKTLGSAAISLIPAQGANTIIDFESAYYSHEYGSVPFDFPSESLDFQINGTAVNVGTDIHAWLNLTSDIITFFTKNNSTHGPGSINQALLLKIPSPSTDATTGDSTATVVIYYRVLTIS